MLLISDASELRRLWNLEYLELLLTWLLMSDIIKNFYWKENEKLSVQGELRNWFKESNCKYLVLKMFLNQEVQYSTVSE